MAKLTNRHGHTVKTDLPSEITALRSQGYRDLSTDAPFPQEADEPKPAAPKRTATKRAATKPAARKSAENAGAAPDSK